jgi:hypothetical protein
VNLLEPQVAPPDPAAVLPLRVESESRRVELAQIAPPSPVALLSRIVEPEMVIEYDE